MVENYKCVLFHCFLRGVERQTLGEELFHAVSQVDSELCAQLTGMLLELDVSVIQHLISDTNALREAVLKAKQEYIRYSQVRFTNFINTFLLISVFK